MKLWADKKVDPMARARAAKDNPNNVSNRIERFVDSTPGYSAQRIAKELDISYNSAYQTLRRKVQKGKLKALYQDGFKRYYPLSYKTASHTVPNKTFTTSGSTFIPLQKSNDLILAEKVEELAKEFVWETGNVSGSGTLKTFVQYLKEKAK